MRLSELIAHGENLIDVVRDFSRGTGAAVDALDTMAATAPGAAEAMQQLGRRNAELKREVAQLRGAVDGMKVGNGRLNAEAASMRSEMSRLRDRAESAERRTRAHLETIQEYYDKLQTELGKRDGKATPANTDS